MTTTRTSASRGAVRKRVQERLAAAATTAAAKPEKAPVRDSVPRAPSKTWNQRKAYSQSDLSAHQKIIVRMGGIRELSRQIDIPVTTIQGWWLRALIPAHVHDLMLRAGQRIRPKLRPAEFFEPLDRPLPENVHRTRSPRKPVPNRRGGRPRQNGGAAATAGQANVQS